MTKSNKNNDFALVFKTNGFEQTVNWNDLPLQSQIAIAQYGAGRFVQDRCNSYAKSLRDENGDISPSEVTSAVQEKASDILAELLSGWEGRAAAKTSVEKEMELIAAQVCRAEAKRLGKKVTKEQLAKAVEKIVANNADKLRDLAEKSLAEKEAAKAKAAKLADGLNISL